jgi:probable F420-dependent oxidoreductase
VKIGVRLTFLPPELWVPVARASEERGLDSVWVTDHLVLPETMTGSPLGGDGPAPIPSTLPLYDAFGVLTLLAAHTRRVSLGTCIYNIGLRHPFVTARNVSTLDRLSDRQVLFGVASGWLRQEWEAAQLEFDHRGARVDETIAVCRRLWTEELVDHQGQYFAFPPVRFEPKPAHAPQLIVGGDSAAALRRVVRLGDGWLPMNLTADRARTQIKNLNSRWLDAGRLGRPTVTVQVNAPDLGTIEQYAAAGTDRLVVYPFGRTDPTLDEFLRYTDEIVGAL